MKEKNWKLLKTSKLLSHNVHYQNDLNKVYSQPDMTHENFKDLTRRIASDEILHNKAFNIAKNPKCDGY